MRRVAAVVVTGACSLARADGFVPVYRPVDSMSLHHGLTGGLALGAGYVSYDGIASRSSTDAVVAELGFWVVPRAAVVAHITLGFDTLDVHGEDGLAIQLWPTEHLRLSLGAGLSVDNTHCHFGCSSWAWGGYWGQASYLIGTSSGVGQFDPHHRIGLALEVDRGDSSLGWTSVFGLLSYQYL